MRTGLFILLLFIGKLADGEIKTYLSCHVFEIPFSEFTSIIYQQTEINVFYDEDLVKQIKVTLDVDSISVESALKIALKNTGLIASAWHNDFIILSGEKLISKLPDFEKLIDNKVVSGITHQNITETETKYVTGRKANAVQTIRVGRNGIIGNSINAKILGRIFDQETGAPVLDATIFIVENGKGAVTDKDGYFSLVINPGKYNARIESLGHEKKNVFLEILSDGEFKFELRKEDILIEEIVVRGDRQTNVKSKDSGLEKIASKTIKEIPMMMGERDILRVSSLLPGIVSVGEGSSGLNVRGGSSDQNAFYIDKIPIYNTSHLFGFFPAFNSDIIKDFSVYKGYIPPQFGGRLSSVFNIITREANRKRFTAHGGINPITGFVTVEGPLIKDSLTVLFSARSSYSDWLLSKIKDPTIRNSSAGFNDFSASFNYAMKKSQLSCLIYSSNDKFRLSDINKYRYSNLGASINYQYVFNTSIKSDFTIIGSEYSFETVDNQSASSAYKHNYKIGHYEIRSDITQVISNKSTLTYGANVILYKLDRGSVRPYGNYSLRNIIDLGKEKGVESALYISNKYNILPRITLSFGLRQSFFTPIGPKTIYTYENGFPRELGYVNDSMNFASNKPIKWYFSPEIRANINFQTDKNGSIKLAFNQMQQNLFMLNNTIALSPNTQWKLADYHIKPSKSAQVSLGVFRNIPKQGLEASIEVYLKRTNNYPEFKDGANFLSTPAVETSILQGNQGAYGIEFFLKRSGKKLDGWLSYTYSKSVVQINGPNSWDKINEGDPYPSNFDIPHVLNALINYHFSRRFIISTVTTYQSGRPITYPQSVYYINGIQYIDYSKRNKYNIPDFFRIDASVTIEGNLKKNKFLHSSFMFSVYNLTGRKNPYSIYFKSEDGLIKCYKYSVIGIPLFTITWLFKLGNYASD
ncbi:MAG: TonB-dependent receptor plug domain-containing protein [Bacteroidales bacterium]|nr:TonB-dependent receptor plug domain-containing protein [Bacteroidales bacterium]